MEQDTSSEDEDISSTANLNPPEARLRLLQKDIIHILGLPSSQSTAEASLQAAFKRHPTRFEASPPIFLELPLNRSCVEMSKVIAGAKQWRLYPPRALTYFQYAREDFDNFLSLNQLGRDVGLCFPSNIPNTSSSPQDRTGTLPSPSQHPLLATPAMVPVSDQTSRPGTSDPSRQTGSAISTEVRRASPSSEVTTPDLLAILKQSFRSTGLSDEAAEMASKSRHQSTRSIYDSRLRHFTFWCSERSLAPTEVSVTSIADFFMHLFISDFQVSTICNYQSAIVAVHDGLPDGPTVSDNTALKHILRECFLNIPQLRD
ncbi:uncharacterized protein LOC110984122 isoform X2 [Acanthaster planci]|nr:uncharacterized protein LOC110984122 isoform X2 [Acanthaster planci]